jgi:signal transduction histidine kinase
MKDETRSRHIVPNISLRIGRISLRASRPAELRPPEKEFDRGNQLARGIHDSLAQSFAGIAMQSAVTEEEITAGERSPLHRIRLINKMADSGLAEARRSTLSLRSTVIEESGLIEALKMLAERSNAGGRLRCTDN